VHAQLKQILIDQSTKLIKEKLYTMWTMIAVYQDHPFNEFFNIALDPHYKPVIFKYSGSWGDKSQ
jgi:hypothetical protein